MSDPATNDRWRPPEFGTAQRNAADIDALKAAARTEGYDAGYREGLAAASSDRARFQELLTALSQPFADQGQAIAGEIGPLVASACRAVIKRELTVAPAAIESAIAEVLPLLVDAEASDSLKVSVHPDDAQRLRQILDDQLSGATWRIDEDASLLPGGLKVASPRFNVDATIEQRITELLERLEGPALSDTPDESL